MYMQLIYIYDIVETSKSKGAKRMIFVLDSGNTNRVLGVLSEQKLIQEWTIRTDRYKTEDEIGILIKSLFDYNQLEMKDIQGIIISSVVPQMMRAIEVMCIKYFNVTPLIVGEMNVHSHLDIRYPRPSEIGADRIVNAVAATTLYQGPLIIIDFGTATTFCYVDKHHAYQGGIITPGVTISVDALYSHAAKLPKIEIHRPEKVIGDSTVAAMQSGVYYGYVGQVDGIVRRMKEEAETEAFVIATGGLAKLIGRGSETIDEIHTNLTLLGLHEIYQKNIS